MTSWLHQWKDLKRRTEVSLKEKKFCLWTQLQLCPNPASLPYGFQTCWDSIHRCVSQFLEINTQTDRQTDVDIWFYFSTWTLTDTDFGTRRGSGGILSQGRVFWIGSEFSKIGSLMWLYLKTLMALFPGVKRMLVDRGLMWQYRYAKYGHCIIQGKVCLEYKRSIRTSLSTTISCD